MPLTKPCNLVTKLVFILNVNLVVFDLRLQLEYFSPAIWYTICYKKISNLVYILGLNLVIFDRRLQLGYFDLQFGIQFVKKNTAIWYTICFKKKQFGKQLGKKNAIW